jgi:hypothetical protein
VTRLDNQPDSIHPADINGTRQPVPSVPKCEPDPTTHSQSLWVLSELIDITRRQKRLLSALIDRRCPNSALAHIP